MEFRDALLGFLRRYNPKYRRTKLARFLKKLWAEEIEKELRAMEDFVLDASPSEDLGRNLIADALGPDATYSKFSPNPTSSANADRAISGISGIESDKTVDDPVHEAKTEMIASPATKGRATQPVRKARGEKEDPIHNEKTALTDPNKYEDLPGDKTSVETPPKGHSVNE
jgi:hypothetical protein